MALSLAMTAVGAAACVDVTPITDADNASDAAAIDVSVTADDTSSACFRCSSGALETGASCGPAYATCSADSKCLAIFMCGLARDCYTAGKGVVQCQTICGAAAGLTSATDPSIAPFFELYTCATSTCAAACSD